MSQNNKSEQPGDDFTSYPSSFDDIINPKSSENNDVAATSPSEVRQRVVRRLTGSDESVNSPDNGERKQLTALQPTQPAEQTMLPPVSTPIVVRRVATSTEKQPEDNTGETEQISAATPVVNPASLAGNSIVDPITGEIPTRASRRVATGEIQVIQVDTSSPQSQLPAMAGTNQNRSSAAEDGSINSDNHSALAQGKSAGVEDEIGKYRRLSQAKKEQRKRSRRRKIIAAVVVIAVLAGVGIAGSLAVSELGGIKTLLFGGEDYQGNGKGQVYVDIPEGATGLKIGRILEEKGVVASADVFADTCKKNSLSQGIQSGRFKLRKEMSAKAALAALLDPAYKADLQVTIPPGFTIEQVKERLIKIANFDRAEVEAAMKNPQELGVPDVKVTSLEGWLAPDTYTVNPKDTPKTILTRMVNAQLSQLDQAGVKEKDRVSDLIKASILEREVNQERYYAQVARVIDNRLQNNAETHGLLQMDSTVLYGIGQRGGLPSKEALKQDTPYNTYLHTGLPPTPIGAPSLKALEAVVKPATGNWLYFVTVNLDSGETKFSASHEEHQKYVEELKQWCEANPGKCSK